MEGSGKKQKEIAKAFVQFYEGLFSSGGTGGVEEVLESMELKVTDCMNEKLVQRFEAAEVELALSQMQPLKSPGPDGFTACFYQQSWPLIGGEVSKAVYLFLMKVFLIMESIIHI